MEKIIMKRNAGKTCRLIEKSAINGDYIVCFNKMEASRIAIKAKEMKVIIPFPITYQEFIERKYEGRNISGFLIDNAEMLLQRLSRVPIKAITLNP